MEHGDAGLDATFLADVDHGGGDGCAGLSCSVATTCSSSLGTTITGKVMDPAGVVPIPNAVVYIPQYDPADPGSIPAGAGIEPITGGISFPAGVACTSCTYLYSGNPISVAASRVDGTFTLPKVPSGTNIPVVVQIGKWRTHTTVASVTDCSAAAAGNINLPGAVPANDPIVSMPQIAVSMGAADTLECTAYRMGLSTTEFTSGASATGHVHFFVGGTPGLLTSTLPVSSTSLWDTAADLEKYDVVIFSCEGEETLNALPANLESYVNAGGRAFLSHYHYAWFSGPIENTGQSGYSYTANADWGGTNVASWNPMDPGAAGTAAPAEIVTTLNSTSNGAFVKGEFLDEWLTGVGALGGAGADAGELEVTASSYSASVSTASAHTQAWATYDVPAATSAGFPTAYFTFDTPIGAVANPGAAPPYCGRVAYGALHGGGASQDTTEGSTLPSSSTCSPGPGNLSAQEKLIEYSLFDLTGCVTPDTAAPGIPLIAPK
jgi:hypothetical protein